MEQLKTNNLASLLNAHSGVPPNNPMLSYLISGGNNKQNRGGGGNDD